MCGNSLSCAGWPERSLVPFMSPFAALDVIRFHEDKEQVETQRTSCNEWTKLQCMTGANILDRDVHFEIFNGEAKWSASE